MIRIVTFLKDSAAALKAQHTANDRDTENGHFEQTSSRCLRMALSP